MIELIISEFVTIALTILKGVSRTPETPKMELCVMLVHGFYKLTNVTKNCILDIAEIQNRPYFYSYYSWAWKKTLTCVL